MVIAACLCFLTVFALTACGGGPKYLGAYVLVLHGAQADVTDEYLGTTIEVDETNNEITLTMLGNSDVFEYFLHEFPEFDILAVYHDQDLDGMVVTTISVSRFGTELQVYYSHVVRTDGAESELVLDMVFKLDTGNQYALESALDVSGSGFISFNLRKDGAVVVEEVSNAFGTVSASHGTFVLTGDEVRVYYGQELTLVGTLVNNRRIEIDLTNAENAGFVTMMSDKNVDIENNTIIIYKNV